MAYMKNRYGADGMTCNSIMDTSIGKIEINERNNRNNENSQATPPGEFSPEQRRRLQGRAQEFFKF